MIFPMAASPSPLAEMAMAGKIGATVSAPGGDSPQDWFGEDQGRYLLAVPADKADALLASAKAAGVPAALIGETGGDDFATRRERPR